MLKTEYIFREQVEPLVLLSYDGDTELLERFHVKPNMVLGEAVQSTLSMFDETAKQVDLNYFKVTLNEKQIGYFVTFRECLYSFGVGMEFRTKDILTQFWNKIKESLEETFVCILYRNNTRAVNWLIKCGMTEVSNELGDNSITLVT